MTTSAPVVEWNGFLKLVKKSIGKHALLSNISTVNCLWQLPPVPQTEVLKFNISLLGNVPDWAMIILIKQSLYLEHCMQFKLPKEVYLKYKKLPSWVHHFQFKRQVNSCTFTSKYFTVHKKNFCQIRKHSLTFINIWKWLFGYSNFHTINNVLTQIHYRITESLWISVLKIFSISKTKKKLTCCTQ